LAIFQRQIVTEVEINAPVERVWSLLSDFKSYPKWNPLMLRLEGEATEGAQLEILIHLFLATEMKVTPTVLKVDIHREIRWRGGLKVPGLLMGEHVLNIEESASNHVRLIHSEVFTGLLAPLFLIWMGDEVRRGFEKMNLEVKLLAEAPDANLVSKQ
jgi:hypothetical protein